MSIQIVKKKMKRKYFLYLVEVCVSVHIVCLKLTHWFDCGKKFPPDKFYIVATLSCH